MTADRVIVWGNCQAAPLAALLREPLAAAGWRVEDVPPVYLADAADVRRVHELVRRCAVLVSQPVSENYRVDGCGTATLTGLLPPGARVVRLPVVYHVGAFPFQVHGYDARGGRVDAPLTDYHDLRVVRAAAAGSSTARTLERWASIDRSRLREVARRSLDILRRRETGLEVPASDLVDGPAALWTMTHPSNAVLAALARRVLAVLEVPGEPAVPEREFLGQRRAAVDAPTACALGWGDADVRPDWVIDGRQVRLRDLVDQQLAFYAARSDVVSGTLRRATDRMDVLFG